MINIDASVIELEPGNSYKVVIKGVYAGIVSDNGAVDDFGSALATIVECFLSYDYDYVETARCLSREGRPLRRYVISVDNGD